MRLLATLLVLPCFCLSAAAQESLVLEKGSIDISDLIRKSGAFLGRSYLLDKTQLGTTDERALSRVELLTRVTLDKNNCEAVVGEILRGMGWIATPLDRERGIWEWIWKNGPRGDEIKQRMVKMGEAEILASPRAVHYVTTTISLRHANVSLVAANLRVFFSDARGRTLIVPVGRASKSLMLAGPRPTVAAMIRTLREIDRPAPPAVPRAQKRFLLEAGRHSVFDLIVRSGQFLGRCYVLDRTQVPELSDEQEVNLTKRLDLDRRGCEEVVGALLLAQGWIARPIDKDLGIYDWILLQGPRHLDLRKSVVFKSPEEILRRPKLIEYVSTIVRIAGDAQRAVANLRTLYSDPSGLSSMIPVGGRDSRQILIAGTQRELCTVIAKLHEMGNPIVSLDGIHHTLQAIERRLAALEEKR